jgi:hypothetical protein
MGVEPLSDRVEEPPRLRVPWRSQRHVEEKARLPRFLSGTDDSFANVWQLPRTHNACSADSTTPRCERGACGSGGWALCLEGISRCGARFSDTTMAGAPLGADGGSHIPCAENSDDVNDHIDRARIVVNAELVGRVDACDHAVGARVRNGWRLDVSGLGRRDGVTACTQPT